MDPDPDPAIFVSDHQDVTKNYFLSKFFCLLFFEGSFTSFFKDKVIKKSQNSRNQYIGMDHPDPQHCAPPDAGCGGSGCGHTSDQHEWSEKSVA